MLNALVDRAVRSFHVRSNPYCNPASANALPQPFVRHDRALLEFPRLRRLAIRAAEPAERAVLGGIS